MAQVNALFSPETSPHSVDLQTFRLLCDTLSFYTLPGDETKERERGGYMPALLSPEEQARFQSLAQELKGHEAEFHSGLLASLSAGYRDLDETSVGSLVSRLRSGKKPSPPQKAENEILWQAMLILKLTEMFREEEREIFQGFLAISGKEAELFAAIRGEETGDEEEDEEEAQALRELAAATTQGGSAINLNRLARAWGRLFIRDAKAAAFPLLITNHEKLPEILAEVYEVLTGRLPVQLVSLTLPTQAESEADPAALAEKFKAATGASRERFKQLLLAVAASEAISAELLAELQEAGNDLNRAALPFLKRGLAEKALRFYAYEGVSFIDLFASLCGETRPATTTGTGILAVLS
ncbi:MAG: hypothetical protein A2505_01120 [Deltaproteobacteria bacterium RIFOXYD12_FULL_55_16]|nr:MAG: hypothetical protein A2505_01120 [Deltaproteobacteria bacterium RIFOXYD12_FULL_55_16]